ncbi:MAG TPA: DNA alkylation repair protein [Acidobacteriota bacterium]|nr:DNA alkylation repair protein [Acidobacteriota bacterium]
MIGERTYKLIIQEAHALSDKQRALVSQSFFKTGVGEYGEGDVFIGLTVPVCRQIAKKWKDATFDDIEKLLSSTEHEFRLIGLLILIEQYAAKPEAVYKFLLAHLKSVNNWDLVDSVAPAIIGTHLLTRPRDVLYKLAVHERLWYRRIAVVATQTFIRNGQFEDTLRISEILLSDSQDLMHKAVGWMLREVGKRDKRILLDFLANHSHKMPSVMMSYAMEHLPKTLRTTIRKEAKILKKKD